MLGWFDTHLGVAAAALLVLAATVLMLRQRRTPQSVVAWLLFLVALPYLAAPAFLLLGVRGGGGRFAPIAFSEVDGGGAAPLPARDLGATLHALGVPPPADGNRWALVAEPVEAWEAATALVDGAEGSVDAIFYMIDPDAVGEAFVQRLAAAARRGVRVRLIIDGLGGFFHPRRALAEFKGAGGELRWFSPLLHWPMPGHLNLRNHRKMIIADGRCVLAGGHNAGARYMGPPGEAEGAWIDLAYRLEGPAVRTHRDVFESDWAATGRRPAPGPAAPRPPPADGPLGGTRAQLVPSGPDMPGDALHDALVQAIHAAGARVWLATPYFVPTQALAGALGTAARRGLDVRLLVPERSNHRVADLARGGYLRGLAEAGCRVLRHPGMVHAKSGVIDGAAWVGSANFDVRSMLLNFEATLFLYDPDSAAAVARWHEALARGCAEGVPDAGPLRRAAEGAFGLGAPML